jgi:DNA/RNA endonuclease YhcR with UshA esterase domain
MSIKILKMEKSMIFMLLILLLLFLTGSAVIGNTSAQEKIEGYVVSVQPNISSGYSYIAVLDMTGTEHNISVNSTEIESKGIMLGDNVRMTISRDTDGNIRDEMTEISELNAKTSGETIEGEVTAVNNSAPTGSSKLNIKDANGTEHTVNVPLYQGENIKPGDKVSIKVVGEAEGTVGSVSRVADSEENKDKGSRSLPGISGVFTVFAVLVLAAYGKRVLT